LQTGRVQVYAASVVIGVAGIGWYLFQPHADVTVDASRLQETGQLGMTAAPGHGYAYRWYLDGETTPKDFTTAASFQVRLSHCETKRVHLDVRNALGRVDSESFEECRESRPGCCREPGAPGSSAAASGGPPLPLPDLPRLGRAPAPGMHDAGVLDDILDPGGRPAPAPARKGGSR
jgi:NADH-quinone oxidoreductase subunit L